MTIWRGLALLVLVGGWLGTSVAAVAIPQPRPTPRIVAVQVGLLVLGYDPGRVDGFWGNRTTAALAAYAQDRRITLNQTTMNLVLVLLHIEMLEELQTAGGEAMSEAARPGASPRMLPLRRW
jgi:peptidoglycan hydrolase-like protein with peptidoglycan-binding domain